MKSVCRGLCTLLAAFSILCLPLPGAGATASRKTGAASAPVYELRLFETNRDKSITVVYRRGNTYIPSSVDRLDYFLRDHLNGKVYSMNPRLFDLLRALEVKVGRPNAVIDVICGYRSPSTNSYLRHHTEGVAKHSLHMLGEAIDIRIPGVPLWKLRQAALALHRGGVGYYPESDFLHVDIGRVRQWELK
ncbi:MAG TPA: DUF882 domain-containing protein [Patescibacteria group bacterium]|nr:DUF882 domain-containing protein [Patescibacteria group bacterium]